MRIPRSVLLLLLLWTANAMAQFEATLDRTQVALGESLALTLTLRDADADQPPDFDPLRKDFRILSQSTQSSVRIINGSFSRTKGWTLQLEPLREGKLSLPPLGVSTDQGTQTSQAIQIEVKPTTDQPARLRDRQVQLEVSLSKEQPYLQETIAYQVRIISFTNLIQPELEPPEVDGAVLEKIGEPQQSLAIRNGQRVSITTVNYALTPMKSGELTIGPARLRAQLAQQRQGGWPQPFGGFPFGGFGYRNYNLASKSLRLTVREPAPGVTPWLPLGALHLEEQWQAADPLIAGEPIGRTLTLVAEGTQGVQLPELAPTSHEGFRLYADHPQYENGIAPDNATPTGTRKETHTLIPLRAGRLTVPPIRIPWWDVDEDKLKYAETPPRTIDVQPNPQPPIQAQPPTLVPASGGENPAAQSPAAQAEPPPVSVPLAHAALYFGAGLLCALLLLLLPRLWRGGAGSAKTPRPPGGKAGLTGQQLARRLAGASQVDEIEHLLREFAAGYGFDTWSGPGFPQAVADASPGLDRERLRRRLEELAAARYGGQTLDLAAWKAEFATLAATFAPKPKPAAPPAAKLPPLNPG